MPAITWQFFASLGHGRTTVSPFASKERVQCSCDSSVMVALPLPSVVTNQQEPTRQPITCLSLAFLPGCGKKIICRKTPWQQRGVILRACCAVSLVQSVHITLLHWQARAYIAHQRTWKRRWKFQMKFTEASSARQIGTLNGSLSRCRYHEGSTRLRLKENFFCVPRPPGIPLQDRSSASLKAAFAGWESKSRHLFRATAWGEVSVGRKTKSFPRSKRT